MSLDGDVRYLETVLLAVQRLAKSLVDRVSNLEFRLANLPTMAGAAANVSNGVAFAKTVDAITAGSVGTIEYYSVDASTDTWTATGTEAEAYNWTTGTDLTSGRRCIVGRVGTVLTVRDYDCP